MYDHVYMIVDDVCMKIFCTVYELLSLEHRASSVTFLNTCRMATPLRECTAPSICTNVLGLRPMGWS
jgi:hypothetical protein